jgi:hypothetical protein
VGRVASEREIQLVLVVKLLQILNRIAAHAEHRGLELVQFFFGVTELVRLARSTGSVGLGEEVENQLFAFEILQAYLLPGVGGQRKVRGLVTYAQHRALLSVGMG